ncbi:MAG: type II and III secretion system protein, partial [Kiritimatiellaeota bacterium]|nr:type II and III secretion system protein [Kiritimatiellota bacterium]
KSRNSGGPAAATAWYAGSEKPVDPLQFTTTDSIAGFMSSGVGAVASILDFNIDVIANAVKSDNRARLVNSPKITTLDNKEAIIESKERIYYSEGTDYYDNYNGRSSQRYRNEDVGIKLQVTPRINKNGYITLEIVQEMQNFLGYTRISGFEQDIPQITTRSMSSTVAVQSGSTIVLGGLAYNSKSTAKSGVPLLMDIPLLGWFFRYSKYVEDRNELVMFLTPRVIETPQAIYNETLRVRAGLDTDDTWDPRWSMSEFADPMSGSQRRKMVNTAEKIVGVPEYPLEGVLKPLSDKKGSVNPGVPFNPIPVNVTDPVRDSKVENKDTPPRARILYDAPVIIDTAAKSDEIVNDVIDEIEEDAIETIETIDVMDDVEILEIFEDEVPNENTALLREIYGY